MTRIIIISALCALVAACSKKGDSQSEKEPGNQLVVDQATSDTTASKAVVKPEPDEPPMDEILRIENAGFETPESVLHDDRADVYLVSNIQGSPLDKDDKAFISKIDPAGKVVELKWIDSAREDVTLNAPKGMTIVGEVLYVADIDVVRMFDRQSGAPKGDIPIKGATFLNDLASDETAIWVSDSGLKSGPNGFAPSGTDAIYTIDFNKDHAVQKLIASTDLGAPNGIAPGPGKLYVATFGSGEVYEIPLEEREDSASITRQNVKKLPKGQLDGVVYAAGMSTLVSSWEAKAIYGIQEDGTVTELIGNVEAPADIDYDVKRRRVLIPLFMKNAVEIHTLK